MHFRRKRKNAETAEINITAFMNLMVILVPFLLITAVFSRMTVLELELPELEGGAENGEQEVNLQLQVVVTDEYLAVRDVNMGLIRKLDRSDDASQWERLREILIEVKSRFPEETGIALLLSPDVSYDTMVQVMDRVASTQQVRTGTLERVELFPDISLGDAPETLEDPA